jgi:hypothetical protein
VRFAGEIHRPAVKHMQLPTPIQNAQELFDDELIDEDRASTADQFPANS